MAGVALGDIGITFAIAPGDIDAQRGAWAGSGGTFGRCDAAVLLCEAGVALGGIDAHFAWQAWHLVTSTLCGRCGTDSTWLLGPAGAVVLCVAWRLVTLTLLLHRRCSTW